MVFISLRFLGCYKDKPVNGSLSGMFRLAAQEAEHLAQAYLGGVVAPQLRKLSLDPMEYLIAAQP